MADSSYEKGLTELAKMKVADLKAELKQRGLPTTGNKNELVERLQLAIHDQSLSLEEATDEIIDEDAVLGDEEIEENEVLNAKPDSQVQPVKRKSTSTENGTPAKKVTLNRKNIVEEVKVDALQKKEEEKKEEKKPESEDKSDKKVIKISEVSTTERLEMRAKKFGAPVSEALSEAAKKEARAARFNIKANGSENTKPASVKGALVDTSYDVLKKRAERFGTNVSSLLEQAEIEAKKEQRKARFGEIKPIEKVTSTKIKLIK
ncbi:hypothetical protein QAD02_010173 [Eretmocerus hayati]|uniref:Uncharacterized protein n=1 Tax=Eretmocerus hayati TaxID=131215 RepID=A0ACC2NBI5_9HYME|nr:hypothetical protein QAD02_010173 [Eretmocerus hayati]